MNPESRSSVSRRDALKTIGATAVLLGVGGFSLRSVAAENAGAGQTSTNGGAATPQPFALPKLAYGYEALEPHIDARTMEIHHAKHHQAYITNANKALAEFPDLKSRSAEDLLANLATVPESIRGTVRNNVGGHLNHSFFWKVIGPNAGGPPTGAIADAIAKSFGSFEEFKAKFSDAAMKRFGSGWAWLSVKDGALLIHSTANQDSPVAEGAVPILGIDVWEHAYYLHYQNRRADYVAAFWSVVNWSQVNQNLATVRG